MSEEQKTEERQQVSFNYYKGKDFRAVYVDGALVQLTPERLVQCAVFSTRYPIPHAESYYLDGDKVTSERVPESVVMRNGLSRDVELELVMRNGLSRDVELELVMRVEHAKEIVRALSKIIEYAEKETAEKEAARV